MGYGSHAENIWFLLGVAGLVSVGAFLTFSDRAIKAGNLDKQDLLGFPIGLYKVIRGFYVLALFGAALFLLVILVGEING